MLIHETKLDGEGHEAVVLLDVPLQDVGAGTQHALKPGAVELDALERALGGDGGGAGPVQHQGDLAEVVRGAEQPDLLALLPLSSVLGHRR